MNAEGLTSPPSTITVYVHEVLTSLGIDPATSTMPLSPSAQNLNTESFSVVGVDQFGQLMGSSPSVIWSCQGGGSINPNSGVYSAPTTGTSATVIATAANGMQTPAAHLSFTAAGGGSGSQPPTISGLSVSAVSEDGKSVTLSASFLDGGMFSSQEVFSHNVSLLSGPAGANPVYTVQPGPD